MQHLIHLKETSSTNQYLTECLRKQTLKEGTVVFADFQTSGKGHAENHWESEAGKNLTFSVLLYPDFLEAQEQFFLSQLVSLALADVLKTIISGVSIKWPNDIYVDDKKIAGVLIENVLSGKHITSSVIGIGVNVNQTAFFSNAPNPVSIKNLTKKDENLTFLLNAFCGSIFARYTQLLQEDRAGILTDYFSSLYRREGYHLYRADGVVFSAKVLTVLPSGQLVLEKKNGTKAQFEFKQLAYLFK